MNDIKPRGYWKDFANVESTLRRIEQQLGRFPRTRDLLDLNENSLLTIITTYHGGMGSVYKRLGIEPLKKTTGYWKDITTIDNHVRQVQEQVGHFPTFSDFVKAGQARVYHAIHDYHGGYEAYMQSHNIPPPTRRMNYWTEWENVRVVLEDLTKQLGHFPTFQDFRELQYSSVPGAIIRHHGGMRAARERINQPASRIEKGHWNSIDNVVAECKEIMTNNNLTRLPSLAELSRMGNSGLVSGIHRHNHSMQVIRERIGDTSEPKKPKRYWSNKENTLAQARILQSSGYDFQNLTYLVRNGHGSLRQAIARYPGGQNQFFVDMGITYTPTNRPSKWNTLEILLETLRDYKTKNGLERLPYVRALKTEIHIGIPNAIYRFGGIEKIRVLLGEPAHNDGHTYNTPQNVEEFAKYIKRKHGLEKLPTQNQIIELGYAGYVRAVQEYGGFNKLREAIGEASLRRGNNLWKQETYVVNEANQIKARHKLDRLPGANVLREMGYASFVTAVDTLHGGFVVFRKKIGENVRLPPGSWENFEFAIGEARRIMKENGWEKLPASSYLSKNGYTSLNTAIHEYHGGYSKFRAALGETDFLVMGRWKSLEYTIQEAKKIMEKESLQAFPGQHVLNKMGYNRIASAINKNHGGLKVFRPKLYEAMGIAPKSSDDVLKNVLETYAGMPQ